MFKIGDKIRLTGGEHHFDWLEGKLGVITGFRIDGGINVALDDGEDWTIFDEGQLILCEDEAAANTPLPLPG